jgi:hypothetical protein
MAGQVSCDAGPISNGVDKPVRVIYGGKFKARSCDFERKFLRVNIIMAAVWPLKIDPLISSSTHCRRLAFAEEEYQSGELWCCSKFLSGVESETRNVSKH